MQSTIITKNKELKELLLKASQSPNVKALPEDFMILSTAKQNLWKLKVSVDNVIAIEDDFRFSSNHLPLFLIESLANQYNTDITIDYSYSGKGTNGIIKINPSGIASFEKVPTLADQKIKERQKQLAAISA